MIVKCIHNRGADLDSKRIGIGRAWTFNAGSKQTEYPIDIGTEFLVLGMSLNFGSLYYLIEAISDADIYRLYPYQLFTVVCNIVPSNWRFVSFDRTDDAYPEVEARWGYREFLFDEEHYIGLIERHRADLMIVEKRKRETIAALSNQRDN